MANKNSREKNILIATITGILMNLVFGVIKIIIGSLSNSIAITTDAFNNFTDTGSSMITLVGYKLSQKPPDDEHPMGHGRIEYISGVLISVVILFTGLQFLQTSFGRILNPEVLTFSLLQLIIIAATVGGKVFLWLFNNHMGKISNSAALKASGTDALMDVVITTATIISAFITQKFGLVIDGYVGLLISLFILYSGYGIIKEAMSNIIGERADRKLYDEIQRDILSIDPIIGAYDMMLHNYGPVHQIGYLKLELPDYASVEDAYVAMEKAQKMLHSKYDIWFNFGLHSVNTYDPETRDAQEYIQKIIEENTHSVSSHAFYFSSEEKMIRFDVIVDHQALDYDKVRAQIISELKKKYPDYSFDVDIDIDYV